MIVGKIKLKRNKHDPTEPQNKVFHDAKVVKVLAGVKSVFYWNGVAAEQAPVPGDIPEEVIGRVDHHGPNVAEKQGVEEYVGPRVSRVQHTEDGHKKSCTVFASIDQMSSIFSVMKASEKRDKS